jgi:DNA invertase Pin-like site-specific DNA recombinase
MTPAAEYIRMSNESQVYSLDNQKAAIKQYADSHQFTVVQTYTDGARSGVTIRSRKGLRQLITDVVEGSNRYQTILVYDVSRWGRFQDTDESAHYEFICRSAGISLHYCAEPFQNDGSLASSLMKSLKRSMAAEFSRELGVKVHRGKSRLAGRGYNVGGRTPFGFRRQIVSEDPSRCRVLESGQRKNVRAERLILVPGPSEEVECVRAIFKMVVEDRMTTAEVGRSLNSKGFSFRGRRWRAKQVAYILTNPEYAGISVWGRSTQRLGSSRVSLAPDRWTLKPDSFTPIVSLSEFDRTQELLQHDVGRTFWTDDRVLRASAKLLKERGTLSYQLFDRSEGMPRSKTLRRFGFADLCERLGHKLPQRFFAVSAAIRNTLQLHQEIIETFADRFPNDLSLVPGRWPRLLLDNQAVISLLLCRQKPERRWRISPVPNDRANVTIICRLNITNSGAKDFFVFPRMSLLTAHRFRDCDPWLSTGKRLDDISQLCTVLRAAVASSEPQGGSGSVLRVRC